MAVAVADAYNRNAEMQSEDTTYLYAGIRTDVAMIMGVSPKDPMFNAAFDMLQFYQSGDGLVKAAV